MQVAMKGHGYKEIDILQVYARKGVTRYELGKIGIDREFSENVNLT